MPKSLTDVKAFLDDVWIACLATVDAANRPYVVPVWFTYDDGKVHVQTARQSVKVNNLTQNSNAAVTVYNDRGEAVVMRGKAHVIEDEEEFKKLTQLHLDKYNRLFNKAKGAEGVEYIKLDEKGLDNMGIPVFDFKIRCILEMIPERVLFW
jgi:nitroimidazol reductase NimA-like FMN-containing flavoprotein (pyridoxamine 5'-phosphate oxidase superfamily)